MHMWSGPMTAQYSTAQVPYPLSVKLDFIHPIKRGGERPSLPSTGSPILPLTSLTSRRSTYLDKSPMAQVGVSKSTLTGYLNYIHGPQRRIQTRQTFKHGRRGAIVPLDSGAFVTGGTVD
jgi:hypothetical protein